MSRLLAVVAAIAALRVLWRSAWRSGYHDGYLDGWDGHEDSVTEIHVDPRPVQLLDPRSDGYADLVNART